LDRTEGIAAAGISCLSLQPIVEEDEPLSHTGGASSNSHTNHPHQGECVHQGASNEASDESSGDDYTEDSTMEIARDLEVLRNAVDVITQAERNLEQIDCQIEQMNNEMEQSTQLFNTIATHNAGVQATLSTFHNDQLEGRRHQPDEAGDFVEEWLEAIVPEKSKCTKGSCQGARSAKALPKTLVRESVLVDLSHESASILKCKLTGRCLTQTFTSMRRSSTTLQAPSHHPSMPILQPSRHASVSKLASLQRLGMASHSHVRQFGLVLHPTLLAQMPTGWNSFH